jgi:branched-chain amino acid transport system ATP-binding protein
VKILELIGVTKYFGNSIVLKDVSFTILEREIFGIIGPNGAGKTTLVNLITGLIPYSAGDIWFFKKSIQTLKPHQIGSLGISRTFEIAPPSTKMTTLENVMVGALFGSTGRERSTAAARRRAMETLEFMGLIRKRDVPAGSLNVLERKRLEIGIALAMNPKLLLLDEVMSGLNPTEIDEGVELIKKVRDEGITLLVVEHVMRTVASACDRILVLHRGEKITEGPPEVVLSNGQVIEAYLGNRYRELTN